MRYKYSYSTKETKHLLKSVLANLRRKDDTLMHLQNTSTLLQHCS